MARNTLLGMIVSWNWMGEEIFTFLRESKYTVSLITVPFCPVAPCPFQILAGVLHMALGGCIVYTAVRLLLLICPLFFFLSHVQKLKMFFTLFSGTVRPRKFKLGTLVDNGWMYLVYQNQAAAAYLSLNFFIFLSLQLSNINIFCHTFLRNCEAKKVETWYTCGQSVHVSCI